MTPRKPWRNLAGSVVDRAVILAGQVRNIGPTLPNRVGATEEATAFYDTEENLTGDARFFPLPSPVAPKRVRVDAYDGVDVEDATWPSTFTPLAEGVVRERYLSRVENRTVVARMHLHRTPAKVAFVFVHGYLGGHWLLEERKFPFRAYAQQGVDVAMPLLPFHALRADPSHQGAPLFPGHDPWITVEAFRQAIFDLRATVAFLRARGAEKVALLGMSLGAYLSALLATLDADLAGVCALTPLAALADVAYANGELGRGEEAANLRDRVDHLLRVVSPLARAPKVPKERLWVIGAEGDRITPLDQAERLAAHWGIELTRIEGSHIVPFGRKDAFRAFFARVTAP
jgi:pimeloyl-ACP methyl ester carboxylesterase